MGNGTEVAMKSLILLMVILMLGGVAQGICNNQESNSYCRSNGDCAVHGPNLVCCDIGSCGDALGFCNDPYYC
ncbi:hypothetical protein SUGI_1139520 [Cryptomeria japonica]|nr:hypothetical protein SUGI_1139520 [Cryptomeria japonica]